MTYGMEMEVCLAKGVGGERKEMGTDSAVHGSGMQRSWAWVISLDAGVSSSTEEASKWK